MAQQTDSTPQATDSQRNSLATQVGLYIWALPAYAIFAIAFLAISIIAACVDAISLPLITVWWTFKSSYHAAGIVQQHAAKREQNHGHRCLIRAIVKRSALIAVGEIHTPLKADKLLPSPCPVGCKPHWFFQ